MLLFFFFFLDFWILNFIRIFVDSVSSLLLGCCGLFASFFILLPQLLCSCCKSSFSYALYSIFLCCCWWWSWSSPSLDFFSWLFILNQTTPVAHTPVLLFAFVLPFFFSFFFFLLLLLLLVLLVKLLELTLASWYSWYSWLPLLVTSDFLEYHFHPALLRFSAFLIICALPTKCTLQSIHLVCNHIFLRSIIWYHMIDRRNIYIFLIDVSVNE